MSNYNCNKCIGSCTCCDPCRGKYFPQIRRFEVTNPSVSALKEVRDCNNMKQGEEVYAISNKTVYRLEDGSFLPITEQKGTAIQVD